MHTSPSEWQLGRSCHLPPQTYSPSFSTPPPLPCPLAVVWVQLMELISQRLGDKRQGGRPTYSPVVSLQSHYRLCPSAVQKDTARWNCPSCLPMAAMSLFSTHPSCVPYTCPRLLKDPFIKSFSKDLVNTCHLLPSRALNDTGLE